MYHRLKGLIREENITQFELAHILGITVTTLNFKINGKSDFTITEAKKISNLLLKDLDEIFFTKPISKTKI